jgi:hypothetical protein
MRLSLSEFETGIETAAGNRAVYDFGNDAAHFGAATVDGRALVWQLDDGSEGADGALISRQIQLDSAADWVMRCDRIDFPPGGIAYTHTHPGPGIRYLLHGRLDILTEGRSTSYERGGVWFESGPDPVLATASEEEPTAFVRVLILPAEWAGKRTIRYVDPADEERPKLQKPTVYLESPIVLR